MEYGEAAGTRLSRLISHMSYQNGLLQSPSASPGLISWDRTMSMYDERIRHSIDVAALCAAYSTCVLSLSESRRISHGQRAHLFWVNAFSLASSWVDHDEPGLLEALLAIAPAAF